MPKQIKIMATVFVGVVGLGALLYFNQPTEQDKNKTARGVANVLNVDKTLHDFGTISMKDGNVKTMFTIKNTSAETVRLSKLSTTCMCTQASLILDSMNLGPFGMPGHGAGQTFGEELAAGAQAQIEVEYDPNAHGPSGIGEIQRSVILEGPSGELLSVDIRANVTP